MTWNVIHVLFLSGAQHGKAGAGAASLRTWASSLRCSSNRTVSVRVLLLTRPCSLSRSGTIQFACQPDNQPDSTRTAALVQPYGYPRLRRQTAFAVPQNYFFCIGPRMLVSVHCMCTRRRCECSASPQDLQTHSASNLDIRAG